MTFAPGGTLVDALTNDPDFARIQQFVSERLSADESDGDDAMSNAIPEAELNR